MGMISIPREGIIDLLDSADKSKLRVASSKFQESLRDLAEIPNVSGTGNLLRFLNGLCNYGGLGTISTRSNGEDTKIVHLRHGLGGKVSDFLVDFVKSFDTGLEVIAKDQENSITVVTRAKKKKVGKK